MNENGGDILKFNGICLILLVVFIFSISAVCAQDTNQTDESDISYSNDLTLANSSLTVKTFTDLEKDISNASSEWNVDSDYKFSTQYDKNYTNGIKITGKTLIINGNGHIIDSDNKSKIFDISNSNIIINNLVFKNSNNSAIFVKNSNLTTNNCVFENNVAKNGGAVSTQTTRYSSTNDKFANNYADKGSAIHVDGNSTLNLNNGTFVSDRQLYWGLVYVANSQMTIANTSFVNISSKYTPAIYIRESKGEIKNCDFINLIADITAGAIGIKDFSKTIVIENCNFINTASRKNAGALFVDTSAEDLITFGKVSIDGCQFINCSSEFGGAILYLGGTLTVNNSNFTSNNAIYDGGAIYSSYTKANILNSNFISNHALTEGFSNGGAYYFDKGTLTINSTRFVNNTASEASSIYTYDSTLILNNNLFNNPSKNGTSIYAVFLKKITDNGNKFNEDVKSLENKNFETNVEGGNLSFIILNNTIHFDELPSSFDLRKYNFTAPVMNQGMMGACWAFGAVEALQSSLIRYTNIGYNFSVNNMKNSMLQYSKYGLLEVSEGANGLIPAFYLISWLGISPSGYDVYDELGKISPLISTPDDLHIMDVVDIPHRKNVQDNNLIKEAILKYGAVEASYYSNHGGLNYNDSSHSQYYIGEHDPDHSICVVGWDDNYSKSNFLLTPPGDGAFIVQNSWGTEWGENGFFYISYYDKTFATSINPIAFAIKNNNTYDMNYQNEISGLLGVFTLPYYSNSYVAEKDGLIAAVGTYFNQTGSNYQFTIYVNDIAMYSQKGISEFRGYSTIPMDKYVQIKKGDKFKVVFKNKLPYVSSGRLHDQKNVSFASDEGKVWIDLYDQSVVALLKVYTLKDLGITSNLVKYYGDKTPFVANVGAGEKVTFEVNGIKRSVVADGNGIAKYPINLNPGNYKITTTYNGTSIINAIVIKNTVAASNVFRAQGSNYNYKIRLVDTAGSVLKNTNVKVSINGKNSVYKTDSKGYITLPFKKLTSKKTITITNPKTGQVVKRTLTVYSRFSGNKNIRMYYFDGTGYNFILLGDDCKTPLKYKYVFININKKTYKVRTNAKGLASFRIPYTVTPGKYLITIKYGAAVESNNVLVKQPLVAKKIVSVKKSSRLVYSVALKGKVVKNKVITLKIKGYKFTARTNSKGIAKFTVKNSVIKKLNAGKKYVITVNYYRNTLKRTLIIKR